MNDFATAFQTALTLIVGFDAELREVVGLSLGVSLSASLFAFIIGAPIGTALAVYRFRGRGVFIVLANALLGLPPVVVGLIVYLLLSRSGPLGSFGILFTPSAMIIAQCALGTPIVVALVHRATMEHWRTYGDAFLVDGASRLRALWPPAPYTLAASAARVAEALVIGSRRRYTCFAPVDVAGAGRGLIAAVPVEIVRGGIGRVLEPALSRHERTVFENGLVSP